MDLPPDAITMLREMGLSNEEIEKVKKDCGGTDKCSFTPEKNDRVWKEYCDTQTNFLKEVYKKNLVDENDQDSRKTIQGRGKRAQAKLIERNPDRLQIAENFQELKEGKRAVEFIYGDFIKNMGDFAFYTVDVRKTLGVKILPSNNSLGQKDEYGRHSCFRLADLATAIDQKELSAEDAGKAIDLAQRVYNLPPTIEPNANDVVEFNNILKKAPFYTVDEMTWHENVDGHTLNLVPSGKLHSGSGARGGQGTGGLPHTGGHSLIRTAEEIIKNRQ